MQTTSALYKSIVSGEHSFENKISIDGHDLLEEDIKKLATNADGLAQDIPTVGSALSAILELTIYEPAFTISRMAEIKVYYRAYNQTQTSEWLPRGTFYVDTRKLKNAVYLKPIVDIVAYDAMMKFEQDYPSTAHDWPYRDTLVIAEMANTIGVSVDSRVNQLLTAGYMIDLPAGYTMRETLEHIAAAYGGNFVMSNEGKLLFVPLYGFDPDIIGNYLADESGNALVFGNEGWCILV